MSLSLPALVRRCLAVAAVLVSAPTGSFGAPPPEASVALEGHAFTAPFTMSRGHIYVSVKVNGKAAVFGLDTDAGMNVVSVDAAKRLGIVVPDSEHPTMAMGAGGAQKSWLITLDSLRIGGAVLKSAPAFVLDLPRSAKLDGLLGYEFLQSFVTTIDYQARTVTFSDQSSPKPGDIVLTLHPGRGVPTVDADVDGALGRFQIDTGDGGTIEISAPFAESNHLREKYPRHLDLVTGLGVGGDVRSSVVRLGTLKLGPTTLRGVAGDLSLQKSGVFANGYVDGVLGYGVLSRFKVTLDYQASKVILSDAGQQDKPFDYNRSGVGFSAQGGRLIVTDIVPGGPGEQAGVMLGDEIVELNGAPVGDDGFDRLTQAAQGAPGAAIRLKLRAADKTVRDVTLTLRELI